MGASPGLGIAKRLINAPLAGLRGGQGSVALHARPSFGEGG